MGAWMSNVAYPGFLIKAAILQYHNKLKISVSMVNRFADHVGGLRVHGGVGELWEYFRRDRPRELSGVTRPEETGARNFSDRRLADPATSFGVLKCRFDDGNRKAMSTASQTNTYLTACGSLSCIALMTIDINRGVTQTRCASRPFLWSTLFELSAFKLKIFSKFEVKYKFEMKYI